MVSQECCTGLLISSFERLTLKGLMMLEFIEYTVTKNNFESQAWCPKSNSSTEEAEELLCGP